MAAEAPAQAEQLEAGEEADEEEGEKEDEDEAAAATPAEAEQEEVAEAEQVVTPKRKKRKRTCWQKNLRELKRKEREAAGGFTNKGREAYRREGGSLVSGTEKMCMADAMCNLLPEQFDLAETRQALARTNPNGNVTFHAADALAVKLGCRLQRVTTPFQQQGGPELALLRQEGLFVVQLSVTYGPDDLAPDLHCVAYDYLTVKDNYSHSKVKVLESRDRESKEIARVVFKSLFSPELVVRLKNIYELTQQ